MAPPKTMAISQQQQITNRSNQGDQTSKSKKRKGSKQQVTNNNSTQPQQTVAPVERQQVNAKANGKAVSKENIVDSKTPRQSSFEAIDQEHQQQKITALAPKERVSIKQQQSNQVPSSQPQVNKENTNSTATTTTATTTNTTTNLVRENNKVERIVPATTNITVLAKQISTDEADEIDAGIELDGSSNSGSSVKDINEDQIKSTSVSPVMAQSNIVNENRGKTKHAVENAPLEQVAGSLCTDIASSTKKISTSKQQLAANLQVIDADEQQFQQKLLQNKQRKPPALQSNTSSVSLNSGGSSMNTSQGAGATAGGGAPQSPAMCKICDQHVYQMERMMAEKAVYHKGCFRCYQCKCQLRIDNYSSHEGQVYCKAHHRQLFQPQVKLDNEDDVDIVAKSTSKVVDDYLLQRGRLSDLSFSFLQPKPEGIRKRQMIICENEPAELPKDVVRSDTKVDDGIDRLNLNLNNILEKFEKGTANVKVGDDGESQPSSAGVGYDKPSFNIKKTLMAFETKTISSNNDNGGDNDDGDAKKIERAERPVVRKLTTNRNGFLNSQSSIESETSTPVKPLAVRRSESLMLRLKKYESRIAGEQVVDDDEDNDNNEDENNNKNDHDDGTGKDPSKKEVAPKKISSIDLSSLKNQWETGDISKRRFKNNADDQEGVQANGTTTSDNCNGYSPAAEKNEELIRIRQQLARKRSGGGSGGGSTSIRNIYENAIKEAQQQQTQAPKSHLSDLSDLNGFSTSAIQQQLLQQNGSNENHKSSTPSTPNKDHFQLNLNNKANKLRARFEQGLVNNSSSYDEEDDNDGDGDSERTMSKMEQLRQEKLEDLSIFAEGEIKAREARNMFQQIDRRLSAASGQQQQQQQSSPLGSRSLSTISANMQAKLQSQMNNSTTSEKSPHQMSNGTRMSSSNNHQDKSDHHGAAEHKKPIRLINNVRT